MLPTDFDDKDISGEFQLAEDNRLKLKLFRGTMDHL